MSSKAPNKKSNQHAFDGVKKLLKKAIINQLFNACQKASKNNNKQAIRRSDINASFKYYKYLHAQILKL